MKRAILTTKRYMKELKLAKKQNLPIHELNAIVEALANDKPLPVNNLDHKLKGNFAGCRECHIRPDWLLIYQKSDDGAIHLLTLIATGSHAHLFDE